MILTFIGDNHRKRTFPLSRIIVPAIVLGNGIGWHPRDHIQLNHEMWCGHQEGFVCQHSVVWRHHYVSRNSRPHAKRDHIARTVHHENQNHRSTRTKILSLDRWINLGVTVHFPTNVDFKNRIWWERSIHCTQKMLLNIHTVIVI